MQQNYWKLGPSSLTNGANWGGKGFLSWKCFVSTCA